MRKAFTLIEMTVALAIVVLMVVFGGFVFKAGIGAQRAGNAQAEVMLKLRTITEQLNSDFRGLRKDAPMMIWFEVDPATGRRFDQIMFFANGDFQSTQVYNDFGAGMEPAATGVPIASNVARISYGHANAADYSIVPGYPIVESYRAVAPSVDVNMLARRQHVLTYGYCVQWPPLAYDPLAFAASLNVADNFNDRLEHDALTLAHWNMFAKDLGYDDVLANVCSALDSRPRIDLDGSVKGGLHMLLSENISSFAIQWSYPFEYVDSLGQNRKVYLWYPELTPPGLTALEIAGFDFAAMATSSFGVHFNIAGTNHLSWYRGDAVLGNYYPTAAVPADFFPDALKFTFTIEDSRGVLEPQTFTHIVYLNDLE